jgi:signal transduction histidine kinase
MNAGSRTVRNLRVTFCYVFIGAGIVVPVRGEPTALTNISQIKRLDSFVAGTALPVRVKGTVVFHNLHKDCFIEDGADAIFVERKTARTALRPGDRIEIEGVTGAGDYAPVIHERNVTVLAQGELPAPRLVDFDQLMSGAEDCRWVEVRGLIRSASVIPGSHVHIQLATGGGFVRAYLYDYAAAEVPHLADSVVRLRGAVGGSFNKKRQLVAPLLFVSGAENVIVVEPASKDPFSLPAQHVATLLQYQPGPSTGHHRVRVRGVVTHQQLGNAVFLRDGPQGLLVKTLDYTPLRPGEAVDVLGFPVMGVYSPALHDAVVRKVEVERTEPRPVSVTAPGVLDGRHDADLIELEAELIDVARRAEQTVLVLQSQNVIFNAVFSDTSARINSLRRGSRLRVTGICLVQEVKEYVSKLSPTVFQVLLRSPADVRVLRRSSWWTPPRLAWAVGALSLVIVLALSWVWVLRRKVQEQTNIIRRQVQREAALEERTRIAREFHDTIEQELVGITMHMDMILAMLRQTPERAAHSLEVARQMVRRSLTEVHRSVWDLRCPALESGDLAAAIREVSRSLCESARVAVTTRIEGQAVRLPRITETHLLRIAQEAINNTVKHAQASCVVVTLRFGAECIQLSIEDNGCGFQTADRGGCERFGLLGMQERAQKMGARLQVSSKTGSGTRVDVQLPLNQHVELMATA